MAFLTTFVSIAPIRRHIGTLVVRTQLLFNLPQLPFELVFVTLQIDPRHTFKIHAQNASSELGLVCRLGVAGSQLAGEYVEYVLQVHVPVSFRPSR